MGQADLRSLAVGAPGPRTCIRVVRAASQLQIVHADPWLRVPQHQTSQDLMIPFIVIFGGATGLFFLFAIGCGIYAMVEDTATWWKRRRKRKRAQA